jgi:hypothetical protein
LNSVRRLINIATVQQALHKGLKSAVTALDTIVRPTNSRLHEKKAESGTAEAAPPK